MCSSSLLANKPLKPLVTCGLVTADHKLPAYAVKTFSLLETETINPVLRCLPVVLFLLKFGHSITELVVPFSVLVLSIDSSDVAMVRHLFEL